jgi:dimethylhistidine N-methyltransferase
MKTETPLLKNEAFLRDVLRGLSRPAKELPCKYFYDERGSVLFEQICELDEYYLTRCELEILARHGPTIAEVLGPGCALIEFGSGSGRKTLLLLDALGDVAAYVPVDINGGQLADSARRLGLHYPALAVAPVHADFTQPFDLPPPAAAAGRRVVYFSGSTIGNFGPSEAASLLAHIALIVGPGGGLLLAFDRKKDRSVLEPAYDDVRGVTAAFNLNLLARINRELGADFDLGQFRHHALFNEAEGRIEMHLISRRPQAVRLAGQTISFAEGEGIRTEYSYKYSPEDVRFLADASGLRPQRDWTDERGWFSVQYLRVMGETSALPG